MEQTYVMVKPDGVQRGLVGDVVSRIEKRGLKIVAMRMNVIAEATAKDHYGEHAARPFFPSLIEFITSGTSCPEAFRARFYAFACKIPAERVLSGKPGTFRTCSSWMPE